MTGKTLRFSAVFVALLFIAACSRLDTLSEETLTRSEARWNASRPASYRMTIEMRGDRVEKAQYHVSVVNGHMATLQRNDREVQPVGGQDYSMDGLFHMLHQEMGLAEKPVLLGAPEGYTAYLMARFDEQTGRLIEYRRSVGGTSNSIEIRVLEFQP